MTVTTDQIKSLRDATGVSVMQCKKALEDARGDEAQALVILKKRSGEAAVKKADRALGAGVVAAYVHHGGGAGAMVTLASETDFVAKNDDFRVLAYDIAMQVTASDPQFLKRDAVPAETLDAVRAVFEREAAEKPAAVRDRIVAGKIDAYFRECVLLEQPFIKDPSVSIRELVERAVQKFGERIEIRSFTRHAAG